MRETGAHLFDDLLLFRRLLRGFSTHQTFPAIIVFVLILVIPFTVAILSFTRSVLLLDNLLRLPLAIPQSLALTLPLLPNRLSLRLTESLALLRPRGPLHDSKDDSDPAQILLLPPFLRLSRLAAEHISLEPSHQGNKPLLHLLDAPAPFLAQQRGGGREADEQVGESREVGREF